MPVSNDDLTDFVYNEERMQDEGRYNEWLDLWQEDAHYWMPMDYQQTEARLMTSLLHEDLFMLRLRVERLNGARTFSQKPRSRCHHVIQRPFIDKADHDQGRYTTHTSMHYVETRLDDQFLLALTATHELAWVDDQLRIANKRVDLLNSDAAFGNIQLLP